VSEDFLHGENISSMIRATMALVHCFVLFWKQDPQAQLYIESLNIVLERQPHEGDTQQIQPLQAITSILYLH
jgi:hypothetical protein